MLLRLVFHDAGTFAAASGDGGANGSLRFELDRPENRGLKVIILSGGCQSVTWREALRSRLYNSLTFPELCQQHVFEFALVGDVGWAKSKWNQ